jgi:hypothetical protein
MAAWCRCCACEEIIKPMRGTARLFRGIFFGCIVRAGRVLLLVCDNVFPHRELLAGLIGFGTPFCNQVKRESPPSAANAKAFRARARPQPSQGDRRLSDLALNMAERGFCAARDVGGNVQYGSLNAYNGSLWKWIKLIAGLGPSAWIGGFMIMLPLFFRICRMMFDRT